MSKDYTKTDLLNYIIACYVDLNDLAEEVIAKPQEYSRNKVVRLRQNISDRLTRLERINNYQIKVEDDDE